jgi:hypothetical protein
MSLASVAPSAWHGDGSADAGARTRGPGPAPLSELELARAAQKAVALAQQEKSTWTRADLIKYLGRVLPRTGRDPAAAAALLEDLADRALRSEFDPVACLEAPEPAAAPRSLLRADGRSIYQRHGGVRYATHAQLTLEERMLAVARATGAPRMTRAGAARTLGADLAQLEAALAGSAPDAPDSPGTPDARTRTGLRVDQAATALAVLTDGRRVSVINAPAGSGKTWVLAAAGRAWAAAGLGRVIGITPSQSARNTLAAGVPESYNTAQFLGHLPGRRGARGPVQMRPGDLVLVDEASMVSTPDLADVIGQAAASGAKVILAGDTQQLQAVENGGGMSLLADALGYAQLTEPVRFRAAWEQQASLRLRDGDTSVLAEYDQHARIRGGEPELMMDAAAAAYLALTLDGTDTLLMAADHALRRELNRRIRDDLIALGIVSGGPAVKIADGTRASAGDLIICTRNDHSVEAGEPGRTLANGDLLRIEAITADGLLVHRALDADPATGRRRWTDRHFPFNSCQDAELGYAVTDHTAQSRTVTAGLAVITGTEDRQHSYIALSRGTEINLAYVFTASPKRADPAAGPRPAPELARYDARAATPDGPPAPNTTPGEALAVLADVLDHDGQQQTATQARHQALADVDHLAILHAIWTAETTPARDQAYRDVLMNTLPPGYRREPGHQAKWLWRTLRAAELAGLDPARALAGAIAERDLAGSRDIAAVIDARLRHRLGTLVPLPPRPWSEQVPALADPERHAYVAEIAALMDARTDRIGEHTAGHPPAWATAALGPVPAHPLDRLAWQRRAAAVGAWRELSGHSDPHDPIGPEPVAAAPDARAAWHQALAALGPAGGPDVRGLPDGRLLHLRDTYPIETAWAPQYVGDELRQVRAAAWDARLAGLRAAAEARAAGHRGDHHHAAANAKLAASYQALERAYREREKVFAQTMADRADWDAATRAQRQLAVAADAELRRRRPASTSPRCARPNPSPPPPLSATSSPSPRTSHPASRTSGSATWPPGTGPSPASSPTGRARRSRPTTPTTPTSARRSPPGPARAGSRSCSCPGPRSRPPRRSSNARSTATPTGKPQTDAASSIQGRDVTAMTATGIHDA